MKLQFFIIGLLVTFIPSLTNAQTTCTTGVFPQQCPLPHYGVSLAWQPSPNNGDPAVSYDAFRSPSGSSNFVQLNTLKILVFGYNDGTVKPQNTYNYMVEAVDANGNLSLPSNIATVTIPSLGPAGTLTGITN